MSNNPTSIYKFLAYEDRLKIEIGLKKQMTFTGKGEKLNRIKRSIIKEIRNYAAQVYTGYSVFPHNTCKYRKAKEGDYSKFYYNHY